MQPGELFTRRWAIATGTTDPELHHLARSGVITRVAHGVYRFGQTTLSDPQAVAISLKGSIGYETAAAWYGAALVEAPKNLHLVVGRSRGRRRDEIPGVILHRTDLRANDRLIVRGMPVTSPLRTALDISRTLLVEQAVAAIDSMLRARLVLCSDLQAATIDLPPAPGRRRAIQVASLVDARAESIFESISRVTMAIAGLPAPTPQLDIFDRDSCWIARVDFAWKEQRVILECDGFEYHGDRDSFERDRRRWVALTRAGWRVIVITWRDLMTDPRYLIDVIGDLLDAPAQ